MYLLLTIGFLFGERDKIFYYEQLETNFNHHYFPLLISIILVSQIFLLINFGMSSFIDTGLIILVIEIWWLSLAKTSFLWSKNKMKYSYSWKFTYVKRQCVLSLSAHICIWILRSNIFLSSLFSSLLAILISFIFSFLLIFFFLYILCAFLCVVYERNSIMK